MGRPLSPRTDAFPFHVVARSNNKDWFSISMRLCWRIFLRNLWGVRDRYGFETHGFVLMSNHFHWLLSTPRANLGDGMCWFQTRTSWSVARSSGRINRIYGGRYKPTLLAKPDHFANCLRYIYQNPVRARITDSVREYPWSTFARDKTVLSPRPGWDQLVPPPKDFNSWIEKLPGQSIDEQIRRAMRRKTFQYPRDPVTRKPIDGRILTQT